MAQNVAFRFRLAFLKNDFYILPYESSGISLVPFQIQRSEKMKSLITIIIALVTAFFSASGWASEPPTECNKDGVQITGKQYGVIGSGVDIRKGPGTSYGKVVNQKATDIVKKTQYVSIDDTTVVFEECVKGEWSWIRVVKPEWLQSSYRGWVQTKFLDKGQNIGGDPYTRKISSSAIMQYDAKNFPKIFKQYKPRLKEIEQLKRKAAEMAVDSGKCDFVEDAELGDSKSTLKNLHFWVDCRNGERIWLDEFEIKKKAEVQTQKEKSWDETSARAACRDAIKARALIPAEVDIHDIIGTSFVKAPITYNVVLTMDFDAKNAFGVKIPYTAKCYFQPGEVGEIEVQKRQ